MTDEMLELARRNAAEVAVDSAEFLRGQIEDIPRPPSPSTLPAIKRWRPEAIPETRPRRCLPGQARPHAHRAKAGVQRRERRRQGRWQTLGRSLVRGPQPGPGAPMDFEATLEFYLRRLQGWNTSIEKILVDPFQMHQTITMLEQAGLPIEPFPQTQPNLTLATETL